MQNVAMCCVCWKDPAFKPVLLHTPFQSLTFWNPCLFHCIPVICLGSSGVDVLHTKSTLRSIASIGMQVLPWYRCRWAYNKVQIWEQGLSVIEGSSIWSSHVLLDSHEFYSVCILWQCVLPIAWTLMQHCYMWSSQHGMGQRKDCGPDVHLLCWDTPFRWD